jgi:hypothetical protein
VCPLQISDASKGLTFSTRPMPKNYQDLSESPLTKSDQYGDTRNTTWGSENGVAPAFTNGYARTLLERDYVSFAVLQTAHTNHQGMLDVSWTAAKRLPAVARANGAAAVCVLAMHMLLLTPVLSCWRSTTCSTRATAASWTTPTTIYTSPRAAEAPTTLMTTTHRRRGRQSSAAGCCAASTTGRRPTAHRQQQPRSGA